jgi:ubiquitin C-terminal hydrolase
LGKEDYSEENELFYLSKIKPKWLKNIDGSCYMNSTLQCFYYI